MEGWATTRIDAICHAVNVGHVGPSSMHRSTKGIPFLMGKNIGPGYLKLDRLEHITSDFHEAERKSHLQAGDVVVIRIGQSGQAARIPDDLGPANCSGLVIIKRPDSNRINTDFLVYFMNSPDGRSRSRSQARGSTRQTLNTKSVAVAKIPLPSLPEQEKIVAILDEAFAAIAAATANAEKNLVNARELFESELNRVFSQKGDGWVKKRLGEVAEFKNGLNFTKSSSGQTMPVVGVGDFQTNYFAPIGNLQTATIDGMLDDEFTIRKDDILTVRSNGSKKLVGRCMLVPDVCDGISYSGFIIRIRLNGAEIVPRFLLHFMKSSSTRNRLTQEGGGANINNINQAKLSLLSVPIPPFSKQEAIASTLDELSEETLRLGSLFQQKLTALTELKQSILHKAFTGELTADAKAASRTLLEAGI